MNFSRNLFLAGVSVLSLASPAFAQDASEEEGATTPIVVEARRKDEDVQDVPLVVNAVSADTLQKLNLREFKDITAVVPGLQLEPGKNVTGSTTSLRGLAVDVNASGNNGTVEFYLNDAPISGGAVLQTMFDVGQIEVLRGPQGTLRGRASPSGSITVTTRRPDLDQFGGYVAGTANNLSAYNGQGAVNLPIVQGHFALRVAGLYEQNESNRVFSRLTTTKPKTETKAFRISGRVEAFDALTINASYTHLDKDYTIFDQVESAHLAVGGTLPVGSTLITAKDRASMLNIPRDNKQTFDLFNWQSTVRFAGQKLDYVASVSKQRLISFDPQDKGDVFNSTFPGVATNYSASQFTYSSNPQNAISWQDTNTTQTTHEWRLSNDDRLFGMFDYVLGGFIQKLTPWTDLQSYGAAVFTGSVAPANYVTTSASATPRRGRTLEQSLFGNLTAHIGESTEISGGARHIKYQENTNGPNNTYKNWVWNASVKHRFSDDFMVYANAGSSFRIGSGSTPLILARSGITLANAVDPLLQSVAQNNPERSKSYEIGFKSSFMDKKVILNVSAFHQDFDGYIFSTPSVYVIPNTGSSTTTLTAGVPTRTVSGLAVPVPAKVDGVEAELTYRPSRAFMLSLNAAYAKSKMNATIPCTPASAGPVPTVAEIQGTGNPNRQVARCTVNQSASRTAPFSGNVMAEYNYPMNDSMDLFARGLVNFNGDSKNDPQNLIDDVKSYALANFYAGVRASDGSWEVTGYVKNLFNTFRVTSRDASAAVIRAAVGATPQTLVSNYRVISTTEPREFGITARFAIGSR
ncbi:TonB-dependent receptor [Novosphingobium sp. TH158]|uniref:TonB-dependent receptor n=1 Tax=Novosphingobium sp. TH158 TaxID=2067455 RepID=UPI0013047BFE|nr:TonB-dependent receptor [Novosphingobium sp. TH158]